MLPTVPPSWILVHNQARYKDSEYESPQDELNWFEESWHWHWKWPNPLKEDARERTVLLAWRKAVFGEAVVSITRDIGKEYRPAFNFAFVMHEYRRLKQELPFAGMMLGKRVRHHRGLIALNPAILKTYYAHRARVGFAKGSYVKFSSTPEVAGVEALLSSPGKSGRGLFLKAEERKCVDVYGMRIAERFLRKLGFTTENVSKTRPCDFIARKGKKEFVVEVKSTTGEGGEVILTRNEVELHRTKHPTNMLVLVHSINLQRAGKKPKATGGKVREFLPWSISEKKLRPLAFTYML